MAVLKLLAEAPVRELRQELVDLARVVQARELSDLGASTLRYE